MEVDKCTERPPMLERPADAMRQYIDAVADDPHPIRLSDDDEDFWVAQAPRAQELLDSPSFSAVIVATNGDMARMNTLAPMPFIRFKQWMSTQLDRDPLKRRRDALQAAAVNQVLQEYLPHLARG